MGNNLKALEPAIDVRYGSTIRDEKRSGSGLRFREARVGIPEQVSCVLKWKDFYNKESVFKIEDISRYGCRITLPSDSYEYRLFHKFQRAKIEIENMVAYSGAITFVNERPLAGGNVSIGISLEGSGCDLDALRAAADIRSINLDSDLQKVLSISSVVRDQFKLLVADLNTVLQEAKQKLDREDGRLASNAQSPNHKMRLEERAINMAMSIYSPGLQAILSKFQKVVGEMSVDEETPHKQYFRLNFQPLTQGTPFVERGITKPLGYSGDYGMMVMLYEYADHGESLFHKFFHRFVCSEPAAVANRNRVGFLSDIMLEEYELALKAGKKKYKITSLACGPAREIYEFVKYAPFSEECPVEIVLVDTEEHALDYAQTRLRELRIPNEFVKFVFLKEDVVTGTIQNKEYLKWMQESDAIICAGLFDYLTERVSGRMIAGLFNYLGRGGQILIGNISKRSPDVFAMNYFMDWRLILRDEPDLLRLVDPKITDSGEGKAEVLAESLGLNLFLKLKKKD